MIQIIPWPIIGLYNLFNESAPISIRFVLLVACAVIVIQQLALMGVIEYDRSNSQKH